MQCKPETRGQYGQKSVLDCMVKTSEEVEDPQFILVSWRKKDTKQLLVHFYNGQMMQLPGYSFAEPSWNNKNMNVSLLVSNTSVQDEGTYSCELMLDSGTLSVNTHMRVTGGCLHSQLNRPKTGDQGTFTEQQLIFTFCFFMTWSQIWAVSRFSGVCHANQPWFLFSLGSQIQYTNHNVHT